LSQGQQVDPQEREAIDQSSAASMGEFEKGLRRFGYSALATSEAFAGQMAETVAPEFTKNRIAGALETMDSMPETLRPNVETFDDAQRTGEYGDYVAGALGEGLGSVGTMVGAGLLTRGASLRAAPAVQRAAQFSGGAAAMLPMEGGETALSLRENPEAMANTTAGERTAMTLGRGSVNAALENIVPNALFTNQIAGLGRRIAPGLRSAGANIARKSVAGTVGEAGTEATQDLTGQYVENMAVPGTGYQYDTTKEAAIRGGLTGGVLGGGGAIAQAGYSNAQAGVDEAVNQAKKRGPKILDATVSSIYDVVNNPANVAEDVANMTMGAVANAKTQIPEYAATAKEYADKGIDIAGDALIDAEEQFSRFIVDNIEPENQLKYMDLRGRLNEMTVANYRIMRDELASEAGITPDKLMLQVGKAKAGAERGAKGFMKWGQEIRKGVARARANPEEGVAESLDRPAYDSAQLDTLNDAFSMADPKLAKYLEGMDESDRRQAASTLSLMALNPSEVTPAARKWFKKEVGVALDEDFQNRLNRLNRLAEASPNVRAELEEVFERNDVPERDRMAFIDMGGVDNYADLTPAQKTRLSKLGKEANAKVKTSIAEQVFNDRPFGEVAGAEFTKLFNSGEKTIQQQRGEAYFNTVVREELEPIFARTNETDRDRQIAGMGPQEATGEGMGQQLNRMKDLVDPEKLSATEAAIARGEMGLTLKDAELTGRESPFDQDFFRASLRSENMERKPNPNDRTGEPLQNSVAVGLTSDDMSAAAIGELLGKRNSYERENGWQAENEPVTDKEIADRTNEDGSYTANINLKSLGAVASNPNNELFKDFLPQWSERSSQNDRTKTNRTVAAVGVLDEAGIEIDPATLVSLKVPVLDENGKPVLLKSGKPKMISFLRKHGLKKNGPMIKINANVDMEALSGEASNVLLARNKYGDLTFPEAGVNYGSSREARERVFNEIRAEHKTTKAIVAEIKRRADFSVAELAEGANLQEDLAGNRDTIAAKKLLRKFNFLQKQGKAARVRDPAGAALREMNREFIEGADKSQKGADLKELNNAAADVATAFKEGEITLETLEVIEDRNDWTREKDVDINDDVYGDEMAQARVNEAALDTAMDDLRAVIDTTQYEEDDQIFDLLMDTINEKVKSTEAAQDKFEDDRSGTFDAGDGMAEPVNPTDAELEAKRFDAALAGSGADWDAELKAARTLAESAADTYAAATRKIAERKGPKQQSDTSEVRGRLAQNEKARDAKIIAEKAAAAVQESYRKIMYGRFRNAGTVTELQELKKQAKKYNEVVEEANKKLAPSDEDLQQYYNLKNGKRDAKGRTKDDPEYHTDPAPLTKPVAAEQKALINQELLTRFDNYLRDTIKQKRGELENKVGKEINAAKTAEEVVAVQTRTKPQMKELTPKRRELLAQMAADKIEDLNDPQGVSKRASKRAMERLTPAQKVFHKTIETILGGRAIVTFNEKLLNGVAAQYQEYRDSYEVLEDQRTEMIKWTRRSDEEKAALLEAGINPYDGATNEELIQRAAVLQEMADAKRDDIAVQGIIRVAAGMEDNKGVAEHEALHGAFRLLFEHRKEDRRVITTAFTAGQAGRRLREFYKDSPEVLAKIDPTQIATYNAEEAAAYGFQVWATDPQILKLGEKQKGVFETIAQLFRSVFNILTTEQKAAMLLKDLQSGRTAETGITALQRYQDRELTTKDHIVEVPKALAGAVSYFTDKLLRSTYSRLMDTDNPALAQIARLGYIATGQESGDRGTGMVQRMRIETTSRLNKLGDMMNKLGGEEKIQEMYEAHIANPEGRTEDDFDKFFQEMRQYQIAAGVKLGDAGPKYFPMPWDPVKVMENRSAFMAMLEKYQDNDYFTSDLALTPGQIWQNIADYTERGETLTDVTGQNMEPVAGHTRTRFLAFLTPEERRPFMSDNADEVMTHYVQQAVRNAEFVRSYGRDGREMSSLINQARDTYGASPEDLALAQDYLDGLLGNKGQGMSRELKDAYGAMTLYQNVRLLPFATFSSLVDPLGIAVRTGDGKAAFEAFTYSMKNLFRDWKKSYTPDQWETIATDYGYIEASGTPISTDARYTGITLTGKTRKWNDTFFKMNLLNGLVRNHHIIATKAADTYLRRASENFFGEDTSRRYLTEVGIQDGDIIYDESLQRNLHKPEEFEAAGFEAEEAAKMAERVRQAMGTVVRQSLISPSSAEMPEWMSNPYLAPIAHLKSFVFGFNKTIIERLTHEARNGNNRPLLYAAAYVPGMIAADFAKDMVNNMGDEPAYKKDWGMYDYTKQGVYRSGLTGAGQFFTDAGKDMTRGGYGIESFGGPTIEQGREWYMAFQSGSGERFWSETVDSLPANAIYDQWIDP
jgi:hypothetical protein